jgi:osmoprotectant transport system permease protein
VLAVVLDAIIVVVGRAATPWERSGRVTRRRSVVAPVVGGAR